MDSNAESVPVSWRYHVNPLLTSLPINLVYGNRLERLEIVMLRPENHKCNQFDLNVIEGVF